MSFEIGDKVYSLLHGWGEVIATGIAVITVDFPNKTFTRKFSIDGRLMERSLNSTSILFHGIPEIIAPPEPDRRPKFEVDAPIMVKNEYDDWVPRHFAGWDDKEGVYVWMAGCTSHTVISTEDIIWFKYWKEV